METVGATGSAAVQPLPPITDERWRVALEEVVRERERLTLHVQPIVELTTGAVAGFEALSRFTGAFSATPDRWFAAAEHWGVNARLQSRVLAHGLAARAVLPPDTFLTVNVEPHLLVDPQVHDVLLDHADLSRLVLELTEHSMAEDAATLMRVLQQLRDRGAMIAMDDAGTGYAGLSQLLALRPHIVKLDRELVTDIDTDPVKRALMEVLGDLVGRMDGWVLAEGIETEQELEAVVRLGVALGQGYVLARPAPTMITEIAPPLVGLIRATAQRSALTEHCISLVRLARVGTDPATSDVVLSADGRPRSVRWGGGDPGDPVRWSPALLVAPSASIADVARRAATRRDQDVGAPVVCTDGQGHVVGLITQADLLVGLAASR